MKKNTLPIALLACCAGLTAQTITTGTLLEEMIDREAPVKFPSPACTVRQFSSYDRASVAPELNGWFGNEDNNQFIRVEYPAGRREYVLFDAQGPGAVVRFWATVAGYSKPMTLRIYLDGSTTPAIQGELLACLGNAGLVADPLAASVAGSTIKEQRGNNLYLPIPYAASCKITVECENALVSPPNGEVLYYNINYRTYPAGTLVRSFSTLDITSRYHDIYLKVTSALKNYDRLLPAGAVANQSGNVRLEPGQRTSLSLAGAKAIRKIKVRIAAPHLPQALRSTVLSISFDNEQRVWAPVGDFFGCGYLLSPYKSWYTEVQPDGTLSCFWVMPFAEQCTVNLENLGEQSVEVEELEITSVDRPWEEGRDMYFGAGWFEEYKIPSKRNNDPFDLNILTLTGKGVLMGNGVTLFNSSDAWWGEGDEKIYVDNEPFPSHFGTGSEDYYGYAWCLPAIFYHPFIAQPDGSGNLSPGYSVNLRYRALDAIPFHTKLTFDMEVWHWAYARINYAPISYYYLLSGTSNLGTQPEMAQNKVVTEAANLFNNTLDANGTIEFEDMAFLKSRGSNNIQHDSFGLKWGNNYQSWWRDASVNDWIEYTFISPLPGAFQVKMNITKAVDYARYDVYFNDRKCGQVDAYNPVLATAWIFLGTQPVLQGNNTIRIVLTGRNTSSAGNVFMAGFDRLHIDIDTSITSETIEFSSLQQYPNPAHNTVRFFGCGSGDVSVYDFAGRPALETSFDSGRLDISRLQPGIYNLHIRANGRRHVTKLIKG
jgi:hypothetical protein